MKKIISSLLTLTLLLGTLSLNVFASDTTVQLELQNNEILISDEQFSDFIEFVLITKESNPNSSTEEISTILDSELRQTRSVVDIWSQLTDAEKALIIRYPFSALKVNTAKNIATEQTITMFGYNGLGDRSDAFRHAIWNAEMTQSIGEYKAKLFADAHEEKDTTGYEADGYSKLQHKNMDLHNNSVGRTIGKNNPNASSDDLSMIIYNDIYSQVSTFIWLHE